MKKILTLLVLTLIVFGVVWTYQNYRKKDEQKDHLILYGNVDVRQVDLGFRVSGRVIFMPFEEGDQVQQGNLIATLDVQPYQDQVSQAQSALETAQINLKNTDVLLKRRQELVGDGGVSQEDLDKAFYSRETSASQVKQAQASLGIALTNLRDTKCFAPADGTILTRIREPGTVVRPADPVTTLSLLSPVWVRAYIPERYLGDVYPGMKAQVFTDTPGGKSYDGQVGFISPVAEFTPKTVETTQLRTDLVYRLRIIAENPDHGLRQGMPVTVRLDLSSPKQEEDLRAIK